MSARWSLLPKDGNDAIFIEQCFTLFVSLSFLLPKTIAEILALPPSLLPEEAVSNIPRDDPLAALGLCVVVKTGVVLLAGGICGLLLESELLLHHPRHTCVVLLQEGVHGHLSLDLLLSEIAVVHLLAVLPTALPHRRTLHHVDCTAAAALLAVGLLPGDLNGVILHNSELLCLLCPGHNSELLCLLLPGTETLLHPPHICAVFLKKGELGYLSCAVLLLGEAPNPRQHPTLNSHSPLEASHRPTIRHFCLKKISFVVFYNSC